MEIDREELRRVARRIMSLLVIPIWSMGQWPYTEAVCPPQLDSHVSTGGDLDWVCLVSGPEEMALARAVEQDARALHLAREASHHMWRGAT